jgi:hypothetical protein
MPSQFLLDALEREFTTKSDRLIELFYADRAAGLNFDVAVRLHRKRWWQLRLWYSQHPGADPKDRRFVPLPFPYATWA